LVVNEAIASMSSHGSVAVRSRARNLLLASAAAALLVALAGCNKEAPKAASQVAVKVNDGEISLHQVDLLLGRQQAVAPEQAEAQKQRLLDTLVEQELAAQAARQQGLDQDPRVVQAIEMAKREVLARAYQDSLAEKAGQPSTDEIERYFDANPALFAQRKLYTVQELGVEATAAQLADVQAKLKAAEGSAQPVEILRAAGLRFGARQATLAAESLPLSVLTAMSELNPGQSLVIPTQGGARVLTVLQAQPAPVDRETAKRAIQGHLVLERKRELVKQGMKTVRDAARIEYVGNFAPAGAASAASR
jgi:EpsD family peptidyl-prolyl cis-trans isomerase